MAGREGHRVKGERVYKQGKVRFFGGWERSLLHEVDGLAIIREIMALRASQGLLVGDVSVNKELDGHLIRFTQKQPRALLLHVKEIQR